MGFHFISATEDTDPLNIALGIAGPSGSGKTYTALRIARGMSEGKPFGIIDTENRRALHYRQDFPEMMHMDFSPTDDDGEMVGYPPERWIEAIDAAEKAGLPALVIDSFSHSHEGIGGTLEIQAAILQEMAGDDQQKADRMSPLSWAKVKPRVRRLTDRLTRAKCHIIICMRAKPVMQKREKRDGQWMTVNAFANNLRRDDLPWSVAADKDLIFDMTATFLVDPNRPGVPIPIKCADHFKPIFGQGVPVGEPAGKAMLEWANGGDTQKAKRLLDDARDKAREGRAAMEEFWRGLSKAQQGSVGTIMGELKTLIAESEVGAENPFAGDAPADDPEEMERIRQEAFAASEAAAREEAA